MASALISPRGLGHLGHDRNTPHLSPYHGWVQVGHGGGGRVPVSSTHTHIGTNSTDTRILARLRRRVQHLRHGTRCSPTSRQRASHLLMSSDGATPHQIGGLRV
jgi:hypothetical protein